MVWIKNTFCALCGKFYYLNNQNEFCLNYRGDIVISKSPKNPAMMICKRVTALAGERVKSESVPFQHSYVSILMLGCPLMEIKHCRSVIKSQILC